MIIPVESLTQEPQRDTSRIHYRNFHNIFLYITERCQLRCGHCYMGDRLERGLTLAADRAKRIILNCHKLGARYITFLGGEPTLHPALPDLIDYANSLGYAQVMIDSNGLSVTPFRRLRPDSLYYVTISLDGPSASIHERVRGAGTFSKTLNTIGELIKEGFRVRINCTVFRFSQNDIEAMLDLAETLGVTLVNFHSFSEEGYGIAHPDWSLSREMWISICQHLDKIRPRYRTSIWYPPTWTTPDRMGRYLAEGFAGCLGSSLDRLSIFPDGRCYVCSLLFDHALHFATMTDAGLILNRDRNEFDLFTNARHLATRSWDTGCPAESILGEENRRDRDMISMCRCWKSQALSSSDKGAA